MASSNSSSNGIRIRRIQVEDVEALARSFYESFEAFNESVGIPPHLDNHNFASAVETMQLFASSSAVYGVVAVDDSFGTILGGGFITPGDMYEVGPIFTDKAFKGRGAAKAVMLALLEKARLDNARSIRLNQVAANVTSFALYTGLGFVPVDCWIDLEGSVTREQASSASHSVGFHPFTGVHVRRMEDADVKSCNELHVKVNGLGREQEIRTQIESSWVAIKDGETVAYTTGFSLSGHAVAESEEALVQLFTEADILRHPDSLPLLPTLHVLGRLYPRLLQWALAAKLKVRRSCWLMVIGFYQPPEPGMIYCPSILA